MELYGSSAWMSRSARRHAQAHRPLDIGLGDVNGWARPKAESSSTVRRRQVGRWRQTRSSGWIYRPTGMKDRRVLL